MGYFPMCLDLTGKVVLLIGNGKQIAHKEAKLRPFGAALRRIESLTAEDLSADVAFVVVGDTDQEEAERISRLCTARRIPVNVVDAPALCSFTFPALVTKGDLTVSVSTGGKAPGAAAYLANQIASQLPDHTASILSWLSDLRTCLYRTMSGENVRRVMGRITVHAFALNRILTQAELDDEMNQ